MKYFSVCLAVALFGGAAACAQNSSAPQQGQRPPTLGQAPEETRPTLERGTLLGGPLTATIMDPHKLRMVKTVYVGRIDNQLGVRLSDDFAKEGPFRVVDNRAAADAILEGSCFDSAHLKDVHSEVFLTGKDGKAIWQDIIHQHYNPPTLKKAVNDTAELIVTHLRESIEATERR